MRPSPRVVGALCAAAMAVTACTSSAADPGEDVTSDAAVTESPSPTESSPSPSPSDPFAMPDPVTKEYVDRVVNTIYEEWGAITREILERPADPAGINPVPVRERIAALFAGQYLQRRLEEADARLRGDRDGLKDPSEFGHIQFRTRRIFAGDNTCIVVAGDIDTSETATSEESVLATLALSPSEEDVSTGPSVGWRIEDLVPNTTDGQAMDDSVMLDATKEDFEGVLRDSCGEEVW
jgi:hypothetical protein